jgi:hypothetical protein
MTHHGAINENGNWTINKKPIPGVDSIESVVDFLGQKRSFWPVPLVNGVGTSDNVDMSATDTANTEVDASDTPTKKKSPSDDASAEAASMADANETKGDDDDGLPAPAQRDNTDMSALILDGNGAPVVVGGTNEPVEEVEEPAREFEGGTYEDVELTRESLTSSYGLQVRLLSALLIGSHPLLMCILFLLVRTEGPDWFKMNSQGSVLLAHFMGGHCRSESRGSVSAKDTR